MVVEDRQRNAMAKEPPSLGELEIDVLCRVWQEQPCTDANYGI